MKKKLFSLLFFFLLFTSAFSQTLFTYGDQKVSADEFLKAYNKNKTATTDEAQSLRDYLNLYINFKLKVQAAKDLRLDTLPSLQSDLENFRSQVEQNYLRNETAVNELVNEAFERSQKDIEATDYFFPVKQTISPADSAKKNATISDAYTQLQNDKNNSDQIVKNFNKDSTVIIKNDLGFITVFTLPYEIENMIYGLKTGDFSRPYRTKNGWHIFQKKSERPAAGKIEVAQILFAFPPGADNNLQEEKKKLADSIYTLITNGADFGKLAKEFSDDRTTYQDGGVLPEFGVGMYDPSFQKKAFALQKDGEISLPFKTEFGYHILKRISATPVPSEKNDEAFISELKQKVIRDSRNNKAQKVFISEITHKTGFKKYKINEQDLWALSDSALLNNEKTKVKNQTEYPLFSFNNGEKKTSADWINYLINSNITRKENQHETYRKLFGEFTSFSIIDNYRKRLEEFNPDFKNQVNEFKNGNMLFEIMQRKVWNKATEDTNGLLNFYTQHQQKYKWNKSAGAVLFSAKDIDVAQKVIALLSKENSWKEAADQYSQDLQLDSGRFELLQLPVKDTNNIAANFISEPVINKNDNSAVFVKILKLYPGGEQRNFEDARGLVINDYQNYLEQNWITQLKKQYPVEINEKVFKHLLK
jgi:peptidyl-prolyl cis-trans isomerase SurA